LLRWPREFTASAKPRAYPRRTTNNRLNGERRRTHRTGLGVSLSYEQRMVICVTHTPEFGGSEVPDWARNRYFVPLIDALVRVPDASSNSPSLRLAQTSPERKAVASVTGNPNSSTLSPRRRLTPPNRTTGATRLPSPLLSTRHFSCTHQT
jgi:hypothetical protein